VLTKEVEACVKQTHIARTLDGKIIIEKATIEENFTTEPSSNAEESEIARSLPVMSSPT
jgi:hypothetical protein